ncbi:hypothetical protein [Photobacterium sanguinicancri]|uniref:hypothetical protein n=1 Tax=Photobacterium sanguinicancri TaxID=875932 RepID=UPI000A6104B3|nr:hypothetical protein [Photobacterium sanguinicancri]
MRLVEHQAFISEIDKAFCFDKEEIDVFDGQTLHKLELSGGFFVFLLFVFIFSALY